jgi:hypothetical protein
VKTALLILALLPASAKPARVAEAGLALPNLHGHAHTPLHAKGKQPAVLLFITHDCPVANKMLPEIRRIAKDFSNKAQFTLVYADPELDPKMLAKHQTDFTLAQINSVHDRKHQLVHAVGATVTPEAVVVLANGVIAYRGRINDLYEDFGKPRRVITQHDLRDALKAVLVGQPAPKPRGNCVGCFIPKLSGYKSK